MKDRSLKFSALKEKYGKKPMISKITGFRLIENVIKTTKTEHTV